MKMMRQPKKFYTKKKLIKFTFRCISLKKKYQADFAQKNFENKKLKFSTKNVLFYETFDFEARFKPFPGNSGKIQK